jgi:hypothetical protein
MFVRFIMTQRTGRRKAERPPAALLPPSALVGRQHTGG